MQSLVIYQCARAGPCLTSSRPSERPQARAHLSATSPRQLARRSLAPAAAARGRRRRGPQTATAAAGGEDLEVAVFRFTLGIPGFDDALVPRVVGALGAALLALNHALGGQPPPDAQVRAEALGLALSAVALAAPTVEQRLRELEPGRGRLAAAGAVEGGASAFALLPELSEDAKKELAWASFALLRNTNICGLAVVSRGRAVMCRGLLGAAALGPASARGDAAATLAALSQSWAGSSSGGGGSSGEEGVYCPDRTAMERAGLAGWACVPAGVETALAQPLRGMDGAGPSEGTLLLLSERPRALSARDRAWAAALAAKLAAALRV